MKEDEDKYQQGWHDALSKVDMEIGNLKDVVEQPQNWEYLAEQHAEIASKGLNLVGWLSRKHPEIYEQWNNETDCGNKESKT